jgi:integrase
MASLLMRIISAFLNHAELEGWIPAPILARRSSRLAPTPAPRDRSLTDAELVRIWHAAGTLTPRPCALVRVLLTTGARLEEVNGISSAEIDREHGLWRLPATRTKNGLAHVLPLCNASLAALEACGWRVNFHGLSKMKAGLDAASGIADWRLHDLRRTMRSGLSRLGISRPVAEAALNHAPPRLVATYDTHGFVEEAVAAVRRWQEHIATLVRA